MVHWPTRMSIRSAAQTRRQKTASAWDARPRRRWLKCKATRRPRRSGQCAHSRSSSASESAPPENATNHGPRRRSPAAQADACSRSHGSKPANSSAAVGQSVERGDFMGARAWPTVQAARSGRPEGTRAGSRKDSAGKLRATHSLHQPALPEADPIACHLKLSSSRPKYGTSTAGSFTRPSG